MLLFQMNGKEIAAVATSLAIAMSDGLTERQVTALASFFAVLGQSLGAIASNMPGSEGLVTTGLDTSGTGSGGTGAGGSGRSGSSGPTGAAVETTAGYTAITGVRVRRGVDTTPTGRSEWYSRADRPTGPNSTSPGPAGTQPDATSPDKPGDNRPGRETE